MVFFNHATRQMTAKIVYYGPGLCGKTTNLNTIYARTAQKARGEMVSLNTETDRTLFFDLLPMDVGMIGGFKTKIQLYTVPGQVFYNSTRKLVLKGVDGIVFVADSQVPMLDANRESLRNLADNLKELGLKLGDIPMVFQWNKRDLNHIVPLDVLETELNPGGLTSFQSIAQDGTGVFETLRGITRVALAQIKSLHLSDGASPRSLLPAPDSMALTVPPPAVERRRSGAEAAAPLAPAHRALLPQDLEALDVVAGAIPGEEAAKALSFLDLPSSDQFFNDDTATPLPTGPRATPRAAEAIMQVMAPLTVKLRPPSNRGFQPGTAVAPPPPLAPRVHLAPMRAVPHPMAQGGTRSAPVVHFELPAGTGDGDLEVVILIRQKGAPLAEHNLHCAAPARGGTGHLDLELKRS